MNSRYFTAQEFACRCGRPECDAPKEPSQELVTRLDVLRDRLNRPVVINSGMRCAFQNAKAGGVTGSAHMTAHEADLACSTSRDRWNMLRAIYLSGAPLFPRLGIAKTFIHVGVSPDLDRQVCWVY